MTCHGKRLFLLFLPLFLFLLCLLPMVACKEEEPAPPPAAEQLPPPENVRSDMGLLRWDEVEHADGYCVRIDGGEPQRTKTAVYELSRLPAKNTYRIEVFAKGDGNSADSAPTVFTYRPDDYPADGYDENGLLYRLTGDKRGYEVSKGKSALVGTIDIRDEVFGLPVLRIAEGAFTPAEGEGETEPRTGTTINIVTTGVHLPDRLESVGAGAFQALTRLEEVVLPDSVTELGKSAFTYCKRLGRVVFPKSLREIPDHCFAYCGLEELNLPEGLERIGKSAFAGSLERILPNGGGYVKWPNTQRFTKVIFPASVKSIGLDAFQGCEQLELVSLPQGLTEMGARVFSQCTALREVIIPEGIPFIGEGAFSYCSSLKEVLLPATVTEIRERAFYACEALEVLRLPAVLETLENRALAGTRVKELILPASLKQFDSSVISSCDVLHSIWYEGTLSQWQARNFPLEKNGKIGNKSTPNVVDVFSYSAEEPESGGNYWHYVDGKPTKW